jgi:transketolase
MRPGMDATVIACGVMVAPALEAARQLEQEGVSCRVVNMSTLKPIDEAAIVKAAEETGAIVTAEEHQEAGGLGSIVARLVARRRPVPMEFVAVKDVFGESGKPAELLVKYGLTSKEIAAAVKAAIKRKG